jgi:hypothetical protein
MSIARQWFTNGAANAVSNPAGVCELANPVADGIGRRTTITTKLPVEFIGVSLKFGAVHAIIRFEG